MGRGYVAMVDTLLAAVYPDQPIWIVNAGISGNTVRDLKARWTADVLEAKPDWLSPCGGEVPDSPPAGYRRWRAH